MMVRESRSLCEPFCLSVIRTNYTVALKDYRCYDADRKLKLASKAAAALEKEDTKIRCRMRAE